MPICLRIAVSSPFLPRIFGVLVAQRLLGRRRLEARRGTWRAASRDVRLRESPRDWRPVAHRLRSDPSSMNRRRRRPRVGQGRTEQSRAAVRRSKCPRVTCRGVGSHGCTTPRSPSEQSASCASGRRRPEHHGQQSGTRASAPVSHATRRRLERPRDPRLTIPDAQPQVRAR